MIWLASWFDMFCSGDLLFFFFSSRRRHTRSLCDWSSDVCSSDLMPGGQRTVGKDGVTCRPQGEPVLNRAPPQTPRQAVHASGEFGGGLLAPARGVKGRRAALFEIAEGEDAGAKLRERSALGQRETANLLRRLFFAAGVDLAPVVLGTPFAVRPMLHLVSSLCLHRVPPMFRAVPRVQIVFGDNRARRVNYCEISRRGVAAFKPRSHSRDGSGPRSRF